MLEKIAEDRSGAERLQNYPAGECVCTFVRSAARWAELEAARGASHTDPPMGPSRREVRVCVRAFRCLTDGHKVA